MYYVNVLPLVESAYVVSLSHIALMEYKVNGTCVVFYIQPVAYVQSLTIHRQRFAVAYVVDEQRYQFLGKLIRTIVVRAVGHDSRHTVCVVKGANEVVGRCLCSRIGRVWIVFCGLQEEFCAVCVVMF